MRPVLIALVAAACGSQSPTPAASTPAAPDRPMASEPYTNPPPDAAPPPADCPTACTEIAICWEEVNPDQEYRQGGSCSLACERSTPEEQKRFLDCVAATRADCAKMLECG